MHHPENRNISNLAIFVWLMRHRTILIISLSATAIFGSMELYAQKTKVNEKKDTGKPIFRTERIKHPKPGEKEAKPVMPLAYYNFSSSLTAIHSFIDSLGNVTSKTDYTYFFDKGSDFFALKETYEYKNKVRSSFWIEELKDSIGFRAIITDTGKTLTAKHLNSFQPGQTNRVTEKGRQMTLYKSTGITKNINGFLCESFVFNDEQNTITIWVTVYEDPMLKLIRHDLQRSPYNELTSFINGIVMQSENYFKQTKHTQKFVVTGLTNTVHQVTTEGVKLISGF